MSKKQHKVVPEVKRDILKRIKEDGVSVSKAAEEHGVSTATIYTWLEQALKLNQHGQSLQSLNEKETNTSVS